MHKIAIIGPECTGKTTLALQLAHIFHGDWVPEYAREYITNLKRKYTYHDVEHIAQIQYRQIKQAESVNKDFVFFDTDLIITKIWFDVVFNKIPDWLDNAIRDSNFSYYFLTDTEIPWIPDPVRENGGQFREYLFQIYEQQLNYYKFPYSIVTGLGNERFQKTVEIMKSHFLL